MTAGVRSMTAVSQHEKKTNGTGDVPACITGDQGQVLTVSVDAVIARMPQRDAQQENDTCVQFSSTACASLNLSFTSFFQLFLLFLPLLTSHPKPPHPLFIFAPTPSHLLCTMPPENLWNPLKFKCVLPLKMTLSLLFSIIESPQPNLYTLTAVI